MATIWVDNQPYQMNEAQNLLHGCLSLGMNLPYFCWHPALGSVGACRQCAVKQFKDESDKHGKLVMACMTPASDGTRISIQDADAVEFRKGVIEGLMLNHPHDCPVCDEGGECHLQDMTVMTGHDYRRYVFDKRTFENQYLGPFLNHEMNRCIQCYRCVRFYQDYAGGSDLNAFSLGHTVYFGRERDGVLESEFAGNLVEICPTGVFTDATLKRHYTRKWDLEMSPSICVHCGLGCNITVAERYGTVRRVINRYHGAVNGYFLCDRGRYGYEFVNSERRIRQARIRGDGVAKEAAVAHLRLLSSGSVIGIGSPRSTLESNFALRQLVGPQHFYAGISAREARLLGLILEILHRGAARSPSLREIEESDAVFILGEDLSNVAPRMALSVRQSVRQQPMSIADALHVPRWMDQSVREVVQDRRGPLFVATTSATRLDEIATGTFRGAPDDLARLGFAVANALDEHAPVPGEIADAAGWIADALRKASRPVVISGPTLGNAAIIQAAANVAWARPGTAVAYTTPECNSMGLSMIGAPALDAALQAEADTVIVLENDLSRRLPDSELDRFLSRFRHIVAIDSLESPITDRAELVLPAATFAESSGTFVSSEGRAQRAFRAFVAPEPIQESWRWLADWTSIDEAIAALAAEFPQLAEIRDAAPAATFRIDGRKVAREPHRYSGRTAMLAQITVHEPKPPDDPDSPLAFSMEGSLKQPPSAVLPFFWSPAWNSIQAVNKFQSEIGENLRGGEAGVRLLEPAGSGTPAWFTEIPSRFEASPGQWLLVPVPHVFGSEELSRWAPGIAQLVPEPYVAFNREGALAFGQQVECLGHRLPVKLAPELPDGIAGVPAGLPPFAGLDLPMLASLRRVS
jgi:NADH-quinone oxidoreductase subunit G